MTKNFIVILSVLLFMVFISTSGESFAQKRDGYYLNPILQGDYADPSIMRDGSDYYMTHSSFDYMPGLTVLHSKDLVNWEPVSFVLKEYLGSVWAPDILKHGDKYYIYFTVAGAPKGGNYVVWADSPYGPWSEPINLNVKHIDPGHAVGEDGTRWLFLSGGHRVRLADDGLSTKGDVEKVYDGWRFPKEWITTGFGLEAPKVRYINGYYYLMCAEGGTLGPPTAHMAVLARSKSINGPWENSPYNPVVHTSGNDEKWWNKGHGSLIDTPDGNWYIVYHAYENGYLNLGRQTLIEPLEWTNDGWLRLKKGVACDKPIKKPIASQGQIGMLQHLSEFRVGKEWRFYREYSPNRYSVDANAITIQGKGDTPHNSSPLLFVGGCHAYELEVEIEFEGDAKAGLVLWYNNQYMVGTGASSKARYSYRRGSTSGRGSHKETSRIWLRLKNDHHVVSGTYSLDGKTWLKDDWGMEISGFNNNTLGGFMSMLPGIFVCGNGKARFSNFKFTPINHD